MPDPDLEYLDVLIIGAGLSGVGAAAHLQRDCPGKSVAILEARSALGGTWDLFRYPGIRSDSDMYTLGYSFRPWEGAKALADGSSILSYIQDTARERGIDKKIRFGHRVLRATWSTSESRWTVEVQRTDSEEKVRLSCGFLFGCTGYYRYDKGFTPAFDGIESFAGRIIHPQHWPEDFDYDGKRVVVIGSGATAVTLVPALAARAEHVTMLQRSPSYVLSRPARDFIADILRRRLPAKLAYSIVRWKNVLLTTAFYQVSRRRPNLVKRLIRLGVKQQLPRSYDIERHFTPRYDPWDQRVCLVPDGDLFKSIRSGRASIVTDRIESFTENGLMLASGAELQADAIVTATGLNLMVLGGMEIVVDGRKVAVPDTVGYKGMMLSGVPNMALALGYTNASWTLKCDLVCENVCRLLRHMDERGYAQCTPRAPDPALATVPFIDLTAGYVLRSIDALPKQGERSPWRLHQNYARDIALLRRGPLEDEAMEFSSPPAKPAPPADSAGRPAAGHVAR